MLSPKYILFAILCLLPGFRLMAQIDTPKVLIVIAHPDDESGFAGSIYKITHDLHGKVDLALVTNGEGGYKYSTLAEDYYHLDLTDPAIGRQYLPAIRKQELMNAGKILGIRNYFFLDQKDDKYTTNEKDPLDTVWDVELVLHRLSQIMTNTHYDFVFTVVPVPETHGHHKAATILALRTVAKLPVANKPIILCVSDSMKHDTSHFVFKGLKGYPETMPKKNMASFVFDRTMKFGYKDKLNYKIITNWEIAEHKSQGVMQMGMGYGDYENFWYYDMNAESGIAKTRALFDALKINHYKTRNY